MRCTCEKVFDWVPWDRFCFGVHAAALDGGTTFCHTVQTEDDDDDDDASTRCGGHMATNRT